MGIFCVLSLPPTPNTTLPSPIYTHHIFCIPSNTIPTQTALNTMADLPDRRIELFERYVRFGYDFDRKHTKQELLEIIEDFDIPCAIGNKPHLVYEVERFFAHEREQRGRSNTDHLRPQFRTLHWNTTHFRQLFAFHDIRYPPRASLTELIEVFEANIDDILALHGIDAGAHARANVTANDDADFNGIADGMVDAFAGIGAPANNQLQRTHQANRAAGRASQVARIPERAPLRALNPQPFQTPAPAPPAPAPVPQRRAQASASRQAAAAPVPQRQVGDHQLPTAMQGVEPQPARELFSRFLRPRQISNSEGPSQRQQPPRPQPAQQQQATRQPHVPQQAPQQQAPQQQAPQQPQVRFGQPSALGANRPRASGKQPANDSPLTAWIAEHKSAPEREPEREPEAEPELDPEQDSNQFIDELAEVIAARFNFDEDSIENALYTLLAGLRR